MQELSKKALRSKAHHLKPLILLGSKGLTEAVVKETDLTLVTHELIKIKINGLEKAERKALALDLCQQLNAELVQIVGHIATIFRQNENH